MKSEYLETIADMLQVTTNISHNASSNTPTMDGHRTHNYITVIYADCVDR
jgi:hypothetical protein